MMLDTSTVINNRYILQTMIGQGGMGTVYRATDRLNGQTVALKHVTIPDEQLEFATLNTGSNTRLALAQEFKVLASLRHPNIISVLDYGFDAEQQPFFTMDLLEKGRSLYGAAKD